MLLPSAGGAQFDTAIDTGRRRRRNEFLWQWLRWLWRNLLLLGHCQQQSTVLGTVLLEVLGTAGASGNGSGIRLLDTGRNVVRRQLVKTLLAGALRLCAVEK